MKSFIQNTAADFIRKHRDHERYVVLLVCLSLVVGLGTWGGLRLNGVAQNHEQKVLACALEVHTHIQDCYDENNTLICGRSDFVLHKHNLDCYDGNGVLVCQLGEHEEHQHDDTCYQTEQVFICDKAEIEAHTHTDECYEDTSTLTCAAAEHTHGEACYQAEQTETARSLICTQPEHLHAEGCYGEDGALLCAEAEHAHTDECWAVEYETKNTLTCTQEEHTHTESCYTAEKQLLCDKTEIAADDPTVHRHGDGCYETVKTLLCEKAELAAHEHGEACYTLVEDFEKLTGEERAALGIDLAHLRSAENAEGKPVYITCGQTELLDHTHAGDCFKTVTLSGDEVEALAPEQPAEEENDDTFVVEPGNLTTRVVENETMKVTAAYAAEAGIPEDSFLRAEIVSTEDERYTQRAAQTQEVLGMTEEEAGDATMTLLDIGFYRIGADGVEVEVEPQATVTVTIQMKENGFAVGDPITVVHFPEDVDGEQQPPEVLDAADVTDEGAATFATDSFSDFMLTTYAARSATTYTKYTGDGSDLDGKEVLIVSNGYAMSSQAAAGTDWGKTKKLASVSVGTADSLNPTDSSIVWTFVKQADGSYKIKNGNNNYLNYVSTGYPTGLLVDTNGVPFTLGGSGGNYTLYCTSSNGWQNQNYYIKLETQSFNASTGQANLSLYVAGEGGTVDPATKVKVSFQNNDTTATDFTLTKPDGTTLALTTDAASKLLKDASGTTSFELAVDGNYILTKQGAADPVYTITVSGGKITSPTGLTATDGVYTLEIQAEAGGGGNEGGGDAGGGGGTDTYATNATFTKYGEDGTTALQGAIFTLTGSADLTLTSGTDGKLATPDGKTSIGLAPGTYILTETAAPENYDKMASPYTFTVSDTGEITAHDYGEGLVKVEKTSSTTEEIPGESGGTTGGSGSGSGGTITGSGVPIEDSVLWDPIDQKEMTWDEYRAAVGAVLSKTAWQDSGLGAPEGTTNGLTIAGNLFASPGMRFDALTREGNQVTWRLVLGPFPNQNGGGWMQGVNFSNKQTVIAMKNMSLVSGSMTYQPYNISDSDNSITPAGGATSVNDSFQSGMNGWTYHDWSTGLANISCQILVIEFKTTLTKTNLDSDQFGLFARMNGNLGVSEGFGFAAGQICTKVGNYAPEIKEPDKNTHTTNNYAVSIKNKKTVTAKLALKKVDEGNNPLPDAGFTLYSADAVTTSGEADGSVTVTPNDGATPMWIGTSQTDGTMLGQDKKAFPALKDGTYYLLETTVPNGYAKPTAITIVVANGVAAVTQGGNTLATVSDATDSTIQVLTITNKRSTVKVEFVKVSTDNTNIKLAGATFDLYKAVDASVAGAQQFKAGNAQGLDAGYYLKIDDMMTSTDSAFGSQDLEIGSTYYLVETKAPDGYLPLTAPVKITTSGGKISATCGENTAEWAEPNTQSGGYTVSVRNGTGQRLPDTGGAGTEPYTMSGLLLIGFALVYITLKGRRVKKS